MKQNKLLGEWFLKGFIRYFVIEIFDWGIQKKLIFKNENTLPIM